MTCTCTHPLDAHVILVALDARLSIVQPCQRADCPCGNYQEKR